MNPRLPPLGCVLLFLCTQAAEAQDLNIDCGPPPVASDLYGAASGQVGYRNSLVMPSTAQPLLGLACEATGVVATTTNSCDSYVCGNCNTGVCPGFAGSADDEAFLGSWINADCAHDWHNVTVSAS